MPIRLSSLYFETPRLNLVMEAEKHDDRRECMRGASNGLVMKAAVDDWDVSRIIDSGNNER